MSLRAAIDRGLANAEAETNYIRVTYVDHVRAELTPGVLMEAVLEWLKENGTPEKTEEIISAYQSHLRTLTKVAVQQMASQREEIERLRDQIAKLRD